MIRPDMIKMPFPGPESQSDAIQPKQVSKPSSDPKTDKPSSIPEEETR